MNKNVGVFFDIQEWRSFRKKLDGTLGFVPTMGALHQGHLSLVKKSQEHNDFTLVSIFINPTQFNDPKDLEKYPKTLEKDLDLLKSVNCDFVMTPTYTQIYPDNYSFHISENSMSQKLCGKSRPGHFTGVLTIVMKLLQIAQADKAYFGKKDYQQFFLIQKMAEAFFLETEIIGCETIRDSDGLAMSSRNQLLTSQQREVAHQFYEILKMKKSLEEIKQNLEKKNFKVDYVEETMGRRFGAVFMDNVRLIDNVEL